MAKKDTFATIANILTETGHADLAEVMEHEIEMLTRKRSTGNAKAKAETEARAEKVYNALAEMTAPVTITELMKLTTDAEVADYSNQRISALMRKLGDRVISEKIKGKTYFTVA